MDQNLSRHAHGHAPAPARPPRRTTVWPAGLTMSTSSGGAGRAPRAPVARAVGAVVLAGLLLALPHLPLAALRGALDEQALLVVAVVLAAAMGGASAGVALIALAALDALLAIAPAGGGGVGASHVVRSAITGALLSGALALVLQARASGRQDAQDEVAWLRHHAFHDVLTHLPNRLLVHDRLSQALREARRVDAPVAVLLIDLDRFKEVNDTWGHAAGDQVLAAVGQRLRAAVRDGDTVGRLGGDEFAAILPRTGEHGATRVAAAVRVSLTAPLRIEGQMLDIGASVGVAVYPDQAANAQELWRGADAALYRAKRRHGRC